MTALLWLTSALGPAILINPDHIIYVEGDVDDDRASIMMSNGSVIRVRESLATVQALVNDEDDLPDLETEIGGNPPDDADPAYRSGGYRYHACEAERTALEGD